MDLFFRGALRNGTFPPPPLQQPPPEPLDDPDDELTQTRFTVYILCVVGLTLMAGLMSGLTLGCVACKHESESRPHTA
jgi:hypothetical protein